MRDAGTLTCVTLMEYIAVHLGWEATDGSDCSGWWIIMFNRMEGLTVAALIWDTLGSGMVSLIMA